MLTRQYMNNAAVSSLQHRLEGTGGTSHGHHIRSLPGGERRPPLERPNIRRRLNRPVWVRTQEREYIKMSNIIELTEDEIGIVAGGRAVGAISVQNNINVNPQVAVGVA